MKRTAVIICPGRGTYSKTELGYISAHHGDAGDMLAGFDTERAALGQTGITTLDRAARFSVATHTRGDNASPLIFTASYLDALQAQDVFDVVAVTGNSMGWYTALAVGGAVSGPDAFGIVNTMGSLMQQSLIGGQSLYPFVDENWVEKPGVRAGLVSRVAEIAARSEHDLAVSIRLGGMLVVAGNGLGLDAFEAELEPLQGRYPMRLPNHAAFHTPLQAPVAAEGRAALGVDLFAPPRVPLVDGRGQIWFPRACTPDELRAYTLGAQVVEPYDFSLAVQVAARSFAPDVFIVTGPGTTLGGAVAQALIEINWKGLQDKQSFQARQSEDPVILSMGRAQDRDRALNARV